MDGVEEREVKLAVPADFSMPALAGLLSGATVVDRGDVALHAVYWDTAELALAQAGVGFRHRNGTWTYKGPSRRDGDAVVREELEIEGDAARIPPEIAARLAAEIDLAGLRPIAELSTRRHLFEVSRGSQEAEVVHDRVSIRDGGVEAGTFAEVEVEHPPGSASLAADITALLTARGAVVDATGKYARALRALGHELPGRPG